MLIQRKAEAVFYNLNRTDLTFEVLPLKSFVMGLI